jgi:hypothetical protein
MVLDPLVPLVRHQTWRGCTILTTSGISFGRRHLAESRFQGVIILVENYPFVSEIVSGGLKNREFVIQTQ